MLTEDYCDFETAKLLKEKGFDEPCYRYYDNKGDVCAKFINPDIPLDYSSREYYLCPSQSMAMKWLREKHNLFIQITVDFSDGAYPMYNVYVVNLAICTSIIVNWYNRYSYKEAVEAAIKFVLKTQFE